MYFSNRIYQGAFASANPRVCTLAGMLRAADPDGIAIARFGWANPVTGRAANERTGAEQLLGFVAPIAHGNRRVYVERGQAYLRPGVEVTLFSQGEVWALFPNGAEPGQPVYAGFLDGSVNCGQAADAELTPWTTVNGCAPGNLAIISTWSPRI